MVPHAFVGFPNDSRMKYDDFDSTKVFVDEAEFHAFVVESYREFAGFGDDEGDEGPSTYEECQADSNWDMFVENVWIVDKFKSD